MASGYRLTPEEIKAVQENGSARDKQAAANGQLAQTFNQKIAQQGIRGKATQISSTWDDNSPLPPAKASAAPTGTQQYIYTGLCAAMNQYEKDLVKKGVVEIANFYEVQFAPDTLKAETVTIPGQTDQLATPMQDNSTSKSKLPTTNKVNNKARNIAVAAGTQIIQFIETTIRNSSYITKQQTAIQDQLTGKDKPSESTSKNKGTTWFKINTKAVPIGDKIDNKRHDFAYHITYTVSTFKINQAESQYFPQAEFQGIHKVYNYWFTGLNTQVLSFEQKYDHAYINAISGKGPGPDVGSFPDLAAQVQYGMGPIKNVPSVASSQSDKGAQNAALNPASTLADFLYSQQDQASTTLQIVGDPAWIQQGEIVGINAINFNYQGFYPDGTINTDAQQAVFAINWNAPTDYNEGTRGPKSGDGLMPTTTSGATGTNPPSTTTPGIKTSPQAAQASAAYVAKTLKSTFSKGKFEQTLTGVLLKNLNAKQITEIARTPDNKSNAKNNTVSKTKPDVRPLTLSSLATGRDNPLVNQQGVDFTAGNF